MGPPDVRAGTGAISRCVPLFRRRCVGPSQCGPKACSDIPYPWTGRGEETHPLGGLHRMGVGRAGAPTIIRRLAAYIEEQREEWGNFRSQFFHWGRCPATLGCRFGGDSTHGAKGWHRRSGAIGQRLFPGTVMRGMKMPGHLGQVRRTTQNLQVIQVREADNLLLIKGAIPGADGDYVVIRESKKRPKGWKPPVPSMGKKGKVAAKK